MPNNKVLLFCFNYAGGTVDFYDELEKAAPSVKFIKLEYSGHGKRMKEPLCKSISEVTDDFYPSLIENLENRVDPEYALLGYSMGCLEAFDMLEKVYNDNIKKPVRVFMAAHPPNNIEGIDNTAETDDLDEWVKQRTLQFGGIDKRLINNKTFWRMYLPIYRADYQMIARYNFDDIKFQTDIPITVFYSEEDTPISSMKGWKKYFKGMNEYIEYSGTHFFIKQHYKEMADVICKRLENYS